MQLARLRVLGSFLGAGNQMDATTCSNPSLVQLHHDLLDSQSDVPLSPLAVADDGALALSDDVAVPVVTVRTRRRLRFQDGREFERVALRGVGLGMEQGISGACGASASLGSQNTLMAGVWKG